MNIELRKLCDIIPYEANPRNNDSAVDAVARSIHEFGFRQPIVVDEQGVIVVGHTRLKAAIKLGMEVVPVHVAVGLSLEQAKAYRIADNQTATIADWDQSMLVKELAELQSMNVDLDILGFTSDELNELIASDFEPQTDPDDIPAPPDEATTQPGDLWILGEHRLYCGDSSKGEDVDRLLDGAEVHLVNTDPPYGVRVEPRSQNAIAAGNSSFPAGADGGTVSNNLRAKDRPIANDDITGEDFERLLRAWFGNMARVLQPGRGFYIWGGYGNIGSYPPALKASELYFSQAVIWVKEHPVMNRKDFMGNHEWCQPADTVVATPDGSVPLSSLRDGDRVISYSRKHNAVIGVREGLAVRRTCRQYRGPFLGVTAAGNVSWCTPGHLWSVKLADDANNWWCVYAMRRGTWWRVGKSKLVSTWGFGVKHRLKTEGGDEVWILSTHRSNVEATVAEQLVLAEYGIPTTTWAESAKSRRTLQDVRHLYDRLDLERLQRNAERVLADHGRSMEHPFLSAHRTRDKVGKRLPFLVRACNLLAGAMQIPISARQSNLDQVRWEPLDVLRDSFDGEVHSIDVERYGHYLADGLVTHNCFYGWRQGAAHVYLGPNNATDVWSVKKVASQRMVHLTEKPVELATRAIEFSSRKGENVLDLFGGSGSTLIAAQQTGRRAFLMEIDPLYADVIVQRWEQFTGLKAERVSS